MKTRRLAFSLVAGLVLAAATAQAQLSLQISPNSTFYNTNGDVAGDSSSIPLGFFGVTPGTWIGIHCVGDYDDGLAGDTQRDLVGVFSASATILPAPLQNRVPNAIPAGPAIVLGYGTAIGNLPMEINQDFFVSRTGFSQEIIVKVPPGATDLFLAVPDAFYADNSDPNQNFGALLWLPTPPAYPGTGEDLELRLGVNGATPTSEPHVHPLAGGNTVRVEIHQLFGTQLGNQYVLLLDGFPTGSPLVGPFPNTWFGALVFTLLGPAPLPATAPSFTIGVPVGLAGLSAIVQAGTLSSLARNGSFLATHAHEVRLL